MNGAMVITVSLIGIDGVGKTTVARCVEASFPVPVKYLYMGSNIKASNHTLFTTRWWRSQRQPAEPARPATKPKRKSVLRTIRKSVGFVNRVAEELYRAALVARYRSRGHVVLLDRHFLLDYYHEDHGELSRQRPLKRRAQGFVRRCVHRMPDLVICLDVAGETAHARKGEFSPDFLEERRRQYLHLRSVVPEFTVVDAGRELDVVVDEVRGLILGCYERRCNGRGSS